MMSIAFIISVFIIIILFKFFVSFRLFVVKHFVTCIEKY